MMYLNVMNLFKSTFYITKYIYIYVYTVYHLNIYYLIYICSGVTYLKHRNPRRVARSCARRLVAKSGPEELGTSRMDTCSKSVRVYRKFNEDHGNSSWDSHCLIICCIPCACCSILVQHTLGAHDLWTETQMQEGKHRGSPQPVAGGAHECNIQNIL